MLHLLLLLFLTLTVTFIVVTVWKLTNKSDCDGIGVLALSFYYSVLVFIIFAAISQFLMFYLINLYVRASISHKDMVLFLQ